VTRHWKLKAMPLALSKAVGSVSFWLTWSSGHQYGCETMSLPVGVFSKGNWLTQLAI
jgi:hypothetical protein